MVPEHSQRTLSCFRLGRAGAGKAPKMLVTPANLPAAIASRRAKCATIGLVFHGEVAKCEVHHMRELSAALRLGDPSGRCHVLARCDPVPGGR